MWLHALAQPAASPPTNSIKVHEKRLGHVWSIQRPTAIPINIGTTTDHPTSPINPTDRQTFGGPAFFRRSMRDSREPSWLRKR